MSPYKPKRPCSTPGCPNLVEVGKTHCQQHKRQKDKQYRLEREKAIDQLYATRQHRDWRKMVLARHPICTECNIKPSVIAHHKDGDRTNFALENGTGHCRTCHERLHAKQGDRF